MYDKRTLTVFPYDTNALGLLLCKDFLKKYDAINLCSLRGWKNEAAIQEYEKYADDDIPVTINYGDSLDDYFSDSDTILFIDSDRDISRGYYIYPQMYKAAYDGKNIIDLLETNEIREDIKTVCKNKYSEYYHNNKNIDELVLNKEDLKKGVDSIRTPIVAVVGEGESTQKFHLQELLKSELEDRGYSTLLIGSKPFCEFLGQYSFPTHLFCGKHSDREQIILFNKYIRFIEEKHNPDIIIIGIPGGMMKCTDIYCGDCGALAFKVFQAIKPDYVIASLFFAEYYPGFFREFGSFVRGRLDCEVDTFNISNRMIDWEELEGMSPDMIPLITISDEFVKEVMLRMEHEDAGCIISITDRKEAKLLADRIIEKLSEDVAEIVF